MVSNVRREKAPPPRRQRLQKKPYRWRSNKQIRELWCSAAAHPLHRTPEGQCPKCVEKIKRNLSWADSIEQPEQGEGEGEAQAATKEERGREEKMAGKLGRGKGTVRRMLVRRL